jgi:hypothetical protein
MDESAVFPIYIVVKYAAYVAWCYFGLKWLRNKTSIGSAFGYGSARLGLGMAFGVAIFVLGAFLHQNAPNHAWPVYLAVYAPVRYVEWSILAALVLEGFRSERRFGDGVTQRWILGGILVSHVADLPLILFTYEGAGGFLPVGRFLC